MLALKHTANDTAGLVSASQLVDKTSSPVVPIDVSTAPRQWRRLTVTGIIQQSGVSRSKNVKLSAVKRRRKARKKKH
jgi:hypothetical protein